MWTGSALESAKGVSTMTVAEPIPSKMLPTLAKLTRSVGHDIKNKLAVVNNSVYYLKMKVDCSDAKVQKHLKIMEREIANANRIVMNLMDFALIKEPVLHEIDVKEAVEETLSQAWLPSDWKISSGLEDGLPLVMANANQLSRVFANIILELIEQAPEGGYLRIIAGERDDYMEVEFWTGSFVIPQGNLAEMFDPLALAGSFNLGVAVSKKLLESYGGTVEVRSLAGEGTTFTLRLPL